MEKILRHPPVTRDELRMLGRNNITRVDSVRVGFGFDAERFADNCDYLQILTMSIDDRLAELRIVIPEASAPVANYVTARPCAPCLPLRSPRQRDGAVVTGTVGDDVDTDTAYDLARRAAIDLLGRRGRRSARSTTSRWSSSPASCAARPAFTEQSAVVNGASDLLVAVFGIERGRHARSAIGVAQLPLGAAVELEAIFEVIGAPA